MWKADHHAPPPGHSLSSKTLFVKILYKYCTNIVQIHCGNQTIKPLSLEIRSAPKPFLYKYCANTIKIYCRKQTITPPGLDIFSAPKLFCTTIVPILNKYCTKITLILYKYIVEIRPSRPSAWTFAQLQNLTQCCLTKLKNTRECAMCNVKKRVDLFKIDEKQWVGKTKEYQCFFHILQQKKDMTTIHLAKLCLKILFNENM